MPAFDRKKHWEHIYSTKGPNDVSWFQPEPATSLSLIEEAGVEKNASIIDIGGGDSLLVDRLLNLEYENITVLDISETALSKAKERLGDQAKLVKWVEADASHFIPGGKYDLWHDRAAFHFLTDDEEIQNYIRIAANHVKPGGNLIIGTFSEQGPVTCSGIEIKQYSKEGLTALFQPFFEHEKCLNVPHQTPFGTTQDFTFCRFREKTIT